VWASFHSTGRFWWWSCFESTSRERQENDRTRDSQPRRIAYLGVATFQELFTLHSSSSLVIFFFRAQKKSAPDQGMVQGGLMKDSGDNRLSRQGHYHGPGGLNGRVRNGNGCDPASMVAGNVPGRRSSRAGHWISEVGRTSTHRPILRMSGSCSTPVCQNCLCGVTRRSMVDCDFLSFWRQEGGSAPIGVVKLLGC
jgi:hypothetical protein